MARTRGRPSLRDQRLAAKRALDFYADSFGKPRLEIHIPEKRERKPRPMRGVDIDAVHRKPLESQVLKAIVQRLRLDPRVASVERNQSGVFREGNRFIRVGTRGKLDLTVYLRDGRYCEIEVKRHGRKPEPHQQARIDSIRAAGGIAGYATTPEEALAILP